MIKSGVKISKSVLLDIVSMAALGVEGVAEVVGFSKEVAESEVLSNDYKGIDIEISNNKVNVNISIVVNRDYEIPEIGKEVQNSIAEEVRMMTGLEVGFVLVEVVDLI